MASFATSIVNYFSSPYDDDGLFKTIEKYSIGEFNNTIDSLKKRQINIMDIRSITTINHLNVLQVLYHLQKDNYNLDYHDTPAHSEYQFIKQAINKLEDNCAFNDFITGPYKKDMPFILLAGTDDKYENSCACKLSSLIKKARDNSFDLERLRKLGPKALYDAVLTGNSENIKVLIKELHVDPNIRYENEDTLLHILCKDLNKLRKYSNKYQDHVKEHHYDSIKVLIENGANPLLINDNYKTSDEELSDYMKESIMYDLKCIDEPKRFTSKFRHVPFKTEDLSESSKKKLGINCSS